MCKLTTKLSQRNKSSITQGVYMSVPVKAFSSVAVKVLSLLCINKQGIKKLSYNSFFPTRIPTRIWLGPELSCLYRGVL